MRYEWGEYAFDGAVNVASPPEEVLRWLVEPGHMKQWIVGVERITLLDERPDVVGSRISLDFGGYGKGGIGSFRGELLELSDEILVRSYRPGFDPEYYERTIRYDVRAIGAVTTLNCSIRTRAAGYPSVLRRLPNRDEHVHLSRSLDRLRIFAEGGQLPLLRRIRDSGLPTQPL
jgi:hypothetical protein